MNNYSDVVVVGAGHNALIAAGYLLRAGLSVTVLEEQEIPGGGAATEELTLPGFRHDTFASAHTTIQLNPVITHDELGLVASGLRYVAPDPVTVVHCQDGETITMFRDVDETAAEIARFSEHDADAYRGLIADWDEVINLRLRTMAAPPGDAVRGSTSARAKLNALSKLSACDLIFDRFEDVHARSLLMWLAGVTQQPPQRPGTGMAATSVTWMFSRVGWQNPVGGSGGLISALLETVEATGGRVVCGRRVERIVVEHGRAGAVLTAEGERFDAARAVISSANAAHLARLLGSGHLPAEFDRLRSWRPGMGVFVVHLALGQTPEYQTASGQRPVTLAGFGDPYQLGAQADAIAEGKLSGDDRWMMAACATVIDPTRAPAGCATLKFTANAPYSLNGDPENWDREKAAYADRLVSVYADHATGYTIGDELGRVVHSPLDIERRNSNLLGGSPQAGDMTADQAGLNRPVPGWSAYRMPVTGLYQTGASTHPGGTVTGFPGRNAARAVLDDLGIDTSGLMHDVADVRAETLA